MGLDPEPLAGRGADGTAHQDVVGEDEVGREQATQHRGVRIDVGALLVVGEVL